MGYRKDEDLLEDFCSQCGQYAGGDGICPNCGAKIFDESGLGEVDENEEGGGGDYEDEPPSPGDDKEDL